MIAGLAPFIVAFVLTLMIGLITGGIELPKPRRKKSKKPVGPVTLNDLADFYDRTAAEFMAKGERENDPYYFERAERLMEQAKCTRKQYLDELMEL